MITNRRLAAIMVADVVDYSRMIEQDEAGTLAALKARRKGVLEPVVKAHGGRIVKLMGDGVLVEFGSAVNAVQGAVELQKQMAAANERVEEAKRIVLRIGINLGDVIGEGSDIYGDGVNVAARLEQLAEPGGICVSSQVNDAIRGKIEVSFEDMGEQLLKNIQRPMRTFRSNAVTARQEDSQLSGLEQTTIAVLPFANMSGDPEQEWFVDGITEDLITELSRHRHLSVLARNTMFVYKGRAVNVVKLGRELGANFVLEGSARKSGDRVRITIQLIDAERGAHVFAEKFDRQLDDIFAVQDEIVDAILARLAFNLDEAAWSTRAHRPAANMTAYMCWLRSRSAWRTGDEKAARDWGNEAVKLDPNSAPALALLAMLYGYWRFSEPSQHADAERARKSREFAKRAIGADKGDAFVLQYVAAAYFMLGEMEEAKRHQKLAFAINPRSLDVLMSEGMLRSFSGDYKSGLDLVEYVGRSEPRLPPGFTTVLGDCRYLARDFEGALAAYRSVIDAPYYVRVCQAMCLSQLGRVEEARQIIVEAPAGFDLAVFARNSAGMCLLTEDRELWLEGFRKAGISV